MERGAPGRLFHRPLLTGHGPVLPNLRFFVRHDDSWGRENRERQRPGRVVGVRRWPLLPTTDPSRSLTLAVLLAAELRWVACLARDDGQWFPRPILPGR